jgi:hypothetical protein
LTLAETDLQRAPVWVEEIDLPCVRMVVITATLAVRRAVETAAGTLPACATVVLQSTAVTPAGQSHQIPSTAHRVRLHDRPCLIMKTAASRPPAIPPKAVQPDWQMVRSEAGLGT